MTLTETLKALQALGTEQSRKIYRRHGAGENLYGVSFANLGKLKKKIKVDHELAQGLWATGNVDARTLATMIADPAASTDDMLDRWAKDLRYYMLTDVFVRNLVSRTAFVKKKAEAWIKSEEEWIGRAGWLLVSMLAMDERVLPDAYFEERLQEIERKIHGARNRVRDAMNSALIAMGLRNPGLEKKAIAAAKRIGKVEVDHGETGCKTPDAVDYIGRAKKRRR